MLQAILFPKWDIPGSNVTQLFTAWEKQVQDYEQQSGDKISDANASEHTREGCCLSRAREEGHFAKDCWYQTNKASGKGKKGKKGKKGQGKGTKPKDGDTKKKGACHKCNEVGHFARECPKKKESNNASSSGGGDVHCVTYTDVQSQWIMMLAEVGKIREQSNNIEFLVDCGAACHAWPCKATLGSSQGGTFGCDKCAG